MTAKNLYPWLIDFAICIGGLGLGVLVYALFFDTTEIGGRHSAPPPPRYAPLSGSIENTLPPESVRTETYALLTDGDTLLVPVRCFRDLLLETLESTLTPRLILLQRLEMTHAQTEEVLLAFEDFVSKLQDLEDQNKQLVSSPEGEHFEIKPFSMPVELFSNLETRLRRGLGIGDWRVPFLINALKTSPFSGDFGKYRQEISIITTSSSPGTMYHQVQSRLFDPKGNQVNTVSIGSETGIIPPRYSRIFQPPSK